MTGTRRLLLLLVVLAWLSAPETPQAQVVDATGKFVIPGLWDMHLHLGGASGIPRFNTEAWGPRMEISSRNMDGVMPRQPLPPKLGAAAGENEEWQSVETNNAGLSPMEVITAATSSSARLLRRDKELGTIQAGKLADLVLLDANPLQGITNTRRINAVVVNGRLLNRKTLDEMLSQLAEAQGRNPRKRV